MSTELRHHFTFEDYIGIEEESEIRHEYFQGDIYAMVGGSLNHNMIKENVSRKLGNQLEGRGCQVLSSDMRVKTGSGLYTYPDVLALCTEPEIEIIQGKETLLNPALIVEVLSRSTKDYDKGDKFEHYKTITSLSEYVLIDQYQPHLIIHIKQGDGSWRMLENKDPAATVQLPLINCRMVVREVYDMVKFQQR